MEQRARRTELQRTVSGLFCVESRVSIAFPLFHLFTNVDDYFESWVYQHFSISRFNLWNQKIDLGFQEFAEFLLHKFFWFYQRS